MLYKRKWEIFNDSYKNVIPLAKKVPFFMVLNLIIALKGDFEEASEGLSLLGR